MGNNPPFSTPSYRESLSNSEMRRYARLQEATQQPSSDPNIDVKYYKLDLTITTSPNYLRGVVTMKAIGNSASLQTVTLDLMNFMTVDSITTGGTSLSFVQQTSTVTVNLDRVYSLGELLSLDVHYRGLPDPSSYYFTFSTHGGIPWIWSCSQPYGARYWWPCKDHPSDKADSVDIWVTIDSTMKVGSNGKLLKVINNGDGTSTYQWAERYPICTYLVSVAITNYSEFTNWFRYTPTDSMPVLNYVLPEHSAGADTFLAKTVEMIRILSDLFGQYPFINEKYGHAENNYGGGFEHQTMTSLQLFTEDCVVHELAHQWFGDMISLAGWRHLWLNEGFAVYGSALYYERHYGTSFFLTYMNQERVRAKQASGSAFLSDTLNPSAMWNWNRVFSKGAMALHMLRHLMGDSVFFLAVKSYAQDPRFRFGLATTEDFRQVCESLYGKPLGYFFDEWIYGQGYPNYLALWSVEKAVPGYSVPLRIIQQQRSLPPSFFTMPIDVRLFAAGWDTTVTIMNNAPDQRFTIHASHWPDSVALDPDYWMLRDAIPLVATAYLTMSTSVLVLGLIPQSLTTRDTIFVVRNLGLVGDSVKITRLPGFVGPDSAVSLFPTSFWVAAGDSQRVTCSIRPGLLTSQTYDVKFQLDATVGVFDNWTKSATTRIRFAVVTGVFTNIADMPFVYMLHQNYPNPFNPSTTIKYELPRASAVRLSVYDVLGREVTLLVNERRDASVHEVRFDGSNIASGVYLYQIQVGDFVQSKKLIILK